MQWLFDLVFPPRTDEQRLRAMSTDDFLALVSPRLVDCTRPGTVALLSFHHPVVRAAVHEAKYHGNASAFSLLGAVLAEYLQDHDQLSRRITVVPIPLGTEREKERGGNQVHQIVLRALQSMSDRETFVLENGLLVRTRETASQVSLAREKREENMHNAFVATGSADPARTYIVVDDVITTGATLQAAVDALRTAGAQNIIPLAIAH
ncbi:hypothetical protein COU19_03125 [Candidatus Kaiserbacteria bacterium CG10_big_fil_rev_8_21_14_0_10_56_12]|uniref:Phosphoribosyltransferase domain-containing protein n=1 Tax=Candidatus Kaiserbacteria bacterium CG10_big_fil_rev_8_21_14_0_10_56_12 TaxID=1974611 RepID=A0A2H0U936_9BACT|nr:MAG: hypothetical protein COU19_03125 [Candidatus Kaiserbacteria bacterium CG10_big_fil_rev_8_21_14_0_10_56_12]